MVQSLDRFVSKNSFLSMVKVHILTGFIRVCQIMFFTFCLNLKCPILLGKLFQWFAESKCEFEQLSLHLQFLNSLGRDYLSTWTTVNIETLGIQFSGTFKSRTTDSRIWIWIFTKQYNSWYFKLVLNTKFKTFGALHCRWLLGKEYKECNEKIN